LTGLIGNLIDVEVDISDGLPGYILLGLPDAAEIFRPVMAVPGPINAPTSEGCHRLIVERVAELVTSVSEIMELVKPISIK
jgi:predicted Rossmann fold nucleotide-binding protein DprA/Smf involved in DNA uptake